MNADLRTRLVDYSALALIGTGVVLGAFAVFGPGVNASLYGVRISSRTLSRPLMVAVFASLFWLSRSTARQQRLAAIWDIVLTHARTVAAFLAVLTFAVALRTSAFEAYGADAYGYVSQAQLWAEGKLVRHEPLSVKVPWPEPEWTLAPLGYRPGLERGTIVPAYPPGLPIVMAGLLKIFGPVGPFLAVPLLGSIAVLTAFFLGRHVAGSGCGLTAAALVMTSPIFQFQLKEPMSDVPVTAWWLLAIVLIARATPVSFVAAGLATTAAIVTRPNLAPLAAMLGMFLVMASAPHLRTRVVNAALFSLGVIPGILTVAVVNTRLYGSPLSSGYGDTSLLFSLEYVWTNLSRYSRWLIESESPFIVLAALGVVVLRGYERQQVDAARPSRPWRFSTLFVAFASTLYACYAFYLPFDNWTFLRFLLPGIPLLLILCSIGVLHFSAKAPSLLTRIVVAGCLLVFLVWRWEMNGGWSPVRPHDRRFAVIADYVGRELPENAIVFSMIHSGSVRYYSGRLTLRWDWLATEWFDRGVAFLSANGYHPYLLIDDWERAQFQERFAGHSRWAALDAPPIATYRGNIRTDVFDLLPRTAATTTRQIGGDAP